MAHDPNMYGRDLVQFFAYKQLPDHLRAVSKPFGVAVQLIITLHPIPPVLAELMGQVASLPSNNQSRRCFKKLRAAWDLYEDRDISRYDRASEVIQLIIEAKDCAVRAVLYKEGEFTINEAGEAEPRVRRTDATGVEV